MVLYIEGFGRFQGTTVLPSKDGNGIRFLCSEYKRKRVGELLKLFVKDGLPAVTAHRRGQRKQGVAIEMRRQLNGKTTQCEVIEISLSGTWLKTSERPPVGDFILLDHLAGQVVRHDEHGIGVEFLTETHWQKLADQFGSSS